MVVIVVTKHIGVLRALSDNNQGAKWWPQFGFDVSYVVFHCLCFGGVYFVVYMTLLCLNTNNAETVAEHGDTCTGGTVVYVNSQPTM